MGRTAAAAAALLLLLLLVSLRAGLESVPVSLAVVVADTFVEPTSEARMGKTACEKANVLLELAPANRFCAA